MTGRLRRLGWACVTVALATGSAAAAQTATSRTIVAGHRFGPIEESTPRQRLGAIFGTRQVRDAMISIGEGMCTPGTEVLPGTPDALDLAWQDAARSRVAFVRTRSARARWTTSQGVHVGSTLSELERLAGRVLTFSGFGWDYGGGLNWSEDGGDLGLRLDIDPRDNEKASAGQGATAIFGDRLVRSDHPLVRQLRIVVGEITHSWGPQFQEVDCG